MCSINNRSHQERLIMPSCMGSCQYRVATILWWRCCWRFLWRTFVLAALVHQTGRSTINSSNVVAAFQASHLRQLSTYSSNNSPWFRYSIYDSKHQNGYTATLLSKIARSFFVMSNNNKIGATTNRYTFMMQSSRNNRVHKNLCCAVKSTANELHCEEDVSNTDFRSDGLALDTDQDHDGIVRLSSMRCQGKGKVSETKPIRRDILRTFIAVFTAGTTSTTTFLLSTSMTDANANFLPFDLFNNNNKLSPTNSALPPSKSVVSIKQRQQVEPAKRATAYLVDSTIPPTLMPLRASREAAILKQIGSGLGTPKTSQEEDVVTLNNVMKKSVDSILSTIGLSDAVKRRPKGRGAASFVFMGLSDITNDMDYDLAMGLMQYIIRPRGGAAIQLGGSNNSSSRTAIGLSMVPQSVQRKLDDFMNGQWTLNELIEYLTKSIEIDPVASSSTTSIASSTMSGMVAKNLSSVLEFAKHNNLSLIALAPEVDDIHTVRKEGLQNVNMERRSKQYVLDSQGFINLTQDPKFKLYAETSMMKDFVPQNDVDDPGNYFAERILRDETVATTASQWAMKLPDSLVIILSSIETVRFMGGANGRIPRVCKYLSSESLVDEEAVTTILLNPTAKNTLSQSRFLRLEIGTSPKNFPYQTKIADYLWFSNVPKVNLLPRLMNY